MRAVIPYLFALLLWIPGSWFLYQSFFGCCGLFAGPALSIIDGTAAAAGGKTVAACSSNLLFGLSGATPEIPAAVKTEYGKVAAYLKENPNKNLTLTGLYGKDEKNSNSKFANLGLSRADAMKSYLIGLGVPAGQLITGHRVSNNLDINENKVYGGIDYKFATVAAAATGAGISISDGSAFSSNFGDNLVFGKSAHNFDRPLSAGLKGVFTKTAKYLKDNPNRSIKLTGFYGKSEKYSGALQNLGVGRANTVKGYLQGLGVSASQIMTDSKMTNNLKFAKNKLKGGVNYAFVSTPDSGDKLAKIEAKLKASPLVLYFATGKDELSLNGNQRQWLSDLIYYLDNKKGAKVSSTGHTDDRGDYNQNVRLSRKRAEFVIDYLKKNGINTRNIKPDSKGPDAPIASNATNEGRAKNRRVEITVR